MDNTERATGLCRQKNKTGNIDKWDQTDHRDSRQDCGCEKRGGGGGGEKGGGERGGEGGGEIRGGRGRKRKEGVERGREIRRERESLCERKTKFESI